MSADADARGLRFDIIISEFRWGTYIVIHPCDDGPFQVPEWSPDDVRWHERGVVLLASSAKAITREEYGRIARHFSAGDWLAWADIREQLEECDSGDGGTPAADRRPGPGQLPAARVGSDSGDSEAHRRTV